MSHRNARLTVRGRRQLAHRVRVEGQAVAHVAEAIGCVTAMRAPLGRSVERRGRQLRVPEAPVGRARDSKRFPVRWRLGP